ncbi:MAG: class I SAM-dependent methyltransferase [Bacteroidales bacterium]|nr:class I SAM-dependent methyltransferase [Bacteroidales bacterium]MBO5978381.1 class I SAM-dependent methyltransferase [Bacteroidales bacterium]
MVVDFGKDYELIDSGDFEKLERFGAYVLRRPEPQAVWKKALPEKDWQAADAYFKRSSANASEERGQWQKRSSMPDQWWISYRPQDMNLRFRLGMTSFKHVGIFPEQAYNWNFIYDNLKNYQGTEAPKVLNLFAYTGGASLAAKAAGADVTHLDAVKQVLNWAHENMEASNQNNIRWMLEDALQYVRREAKRGKRYQGIIMDPPAYGRGPKGEKWVLEEGIAPLMEACSQLLDEQHGFLILNLYSMGFSSWVADNLIKCYFPNAQEVENGDLSFVDRAGRRLPLSVYARFVNK